MRHAVRAIVIKDDQLLVMDRDKFGNKYCSLIGGGVDAGETIEQALLREMHEETGVVISQPRLVIVEDSGQIYGRQHVFLCNYVSGEPALHPDSEEAKITSLGRNLYQPKWLPLAELAGANFLPKELKQTLIDCLANGFPAEPIQLTIQA